MASSAQVNGTLTAFKEEMSLCRTDFDNLTASWKGTSADSLIPKGIESMDKRQTSITKGLQELASALDKYDEYEECKKQIKEYNEKLTATKKKLDELKSLPETPSKSGQLYGKQQDIYYYKNKIKEEQEKQEKLADEINKHLENARDSVKDITKKPKQEVPKAEIKDSAGKMITKTINGVEGMYLKFNENTIFKVIGKQPFSGPCGIYCMAYGWNIIEGKNRAPSGNVQELRDKYNGGGETNMCQWYNMTPTIYNSTQARMNAIWDEVVVNQKPCVAAVEGSSENHYVCVVGVRKGAKKKNLKPSDLIILDPSAPNNILCYYGQGYKNNFNGSTYGLQLVTFNTKKK